MNPEPLTLDWPAPVMTVSEVAHVVRVTSKTVRQHIRRGHLRAIQLDSGPYRVRVADAQRWVDEQLVAPDAGALAIDRYLRRDDAAIAVPANGRRQPTIVDEFGARRRGRA